MSKLILQTSTQGIRGGKSTNSFNGYSMLTVRKDGRESLQISVDTFEGSGNTYKERENAQIEIYFQGCEMWRGTPEELKKALNIKSI